MPTESHISPRRVAIVHDWLISSRGGEKVLEAILELFPQAEIFTLFYDSNRVSEKIRRHPVHVSFLNRFPQAHRYYRHLLPLFPMAIERFDLTDFDLVISSSHCVAKGVIVGPQALHLCYCHTPMRYAWDRYRDYFPPGWKEGLVFPFIHYLRIWDVTSSARVDGFIANSSWVARRIEKYYRRSSEIIHPFVDLSAYPLSEKKRESHYLAVSAFAPYKRLDLAIEACRKLDRKLRIVGEGQDSALLKRLAGDNVTFLGRLDSDGLRREYAEARALLFPGEEDFGITPLEAMASGTPVLAFGRGGTLDSILPGETGLFFPEQTVESLTQAMLKFEASEMHFSPARCRTRAESFGREAFQRRFTEVLQQLDQKQK